VRFAEGKALAPFASVIGRTFAGASFDDVRAALTAEAHGTAAGGAAHRMAVDSVHAADPDRSRAAECGPPSHTRPLHPPPPLSLSLI
jgi:hypothetical protein